MPIIATGCKVTEHRSASNGARLLAKPSPFKGHDILTAKQFTRASVEHLLDVADEMSTVVQTKGGNDLLKGRVMMSLFMEPSTRTASSFQAAMLRLGGSVIPIYESASSSVKGETFEDTIRVLEQYADAIVIRHPQIGQAARAANVASIPIINAGDGAGEHPTQAILDTYGIRCMKKRLDGLTITVVGDLLYGRTIHSLARIFALFDGIKVNFVSTKSLSLPAEVRQEITGKLNFTESTMDQLGPRVAEADVLYATRIQKERFRSQAEYEAEKGSYCISTELLDHFGAKKDLVVMHPLPRIDEIAHSFDADPRAAYFKQVRFGMIARMAILSEVLRP